MAANCPECDAEIEVDEMDVEVGDELSCSECGALIRVASDAPLELELADDDDEDVDDDDEDEDDDEDKDEDEDEDAEDGEEEGWNEKDED
jgi:alpha-aminoadipate/glutamate carrier protein LysW